jgi:Ser/Thr protein kinase RdoA (MazF antagonist)
LVIEKSAFAFRLDGTPVTCEAFGHGHINHTLKIITDTGAEYVLQRINTYVFKDPVRLMENICAVTEFIRSRVEDPRQALRFLPTHEGKFWHVDDAGQFWRCCNFVGGLCLDAPESDGDFYQSAIAFGRFQTLLADFPADTLYETIPEFHNTADRYRQFREAVALDLCGRASEVQADIDFLLEREDLACTLQNMRQEGLLPLRVTHNDTKLNNVMLDKTTRQALCVLDLDTVMPGLSLYDFGDSIRFGAATAAEDEQDLSKMELDLHLFEVYTRGYLEAATALTDTEIAMLPMGALAVTLELATRFLKDHLDGDRYFKTAYPGHNLVRARTQMKLAYDMQQKWENMNRIVATVARQVR